MNVCETTMGMDMDGRAVAQRIRERLEALGKSAAGASLEAGLGRSAVQNILSGASESPRNSTLRALAGPLECSLEFLLGIEEWDRGYEDPFTPSVKTMRPTVIERAVILEEGVYSAEQRFARLEHEAIVGHADLRLSGHRIEYYRLNDGTGYDEGFREGDVLFAASASEDSPLSLFTDCAVVVERRLKAPSLLEMTLRTVGIHKGELTLFGREERLRVTLKDPAKMPQVGDEFELEDQSTITIRGMVIRLSRPITHKATVYAIQKDRSD